MNNFFYKLGGKLIIMFPIIFLITLGFLSAQETISFTIINGAEIRCAADSTVNIVISPNVSADFIEINLLWGDGNTETIFPGETLDRTHTYSTYEFLGEPSYNCAVNPLVNGFCFNISVIATYDNISDENASKIIIYKIPPIAEFILDQTTVCEGDTVCFSNRTYPDNDNDMMYSWDFGNGLISSSLDTCIDYLSTGLHDITLSATNICGTDTRVKSINVLDSSLAEVNFSNNDTIAYSPYLINFINESTNGNAYYWEIFQDGQRILDSITFSTTPLEYNFTSQGNYLVRMTNQSNCGDKIWEQVFIISNNPFICNAELTSEESTIIIPAEAMPMLNGDTLPYGTIIRATYEADGEKRCAGQTIWEGENTYISVVGNDAPSPEANGYMDNQEYTYCFILPSGCIITDISTTYLTGGIFDAGDSFEADGISGVASMQGSISFMLELDLNAPDTCNAGTGALSVFALNGVEPINYMWSNGVTGEIVEGLEANDTLVVQAIDANGCPASLENIITSSPCPFIQSMGTSNENEQGSSGCQPFEVNFQNNSIAEAGVDSLIWQFGDGTFSVNDNNPTHVYENTDSYTALLIVFDGFQYDTSSFLIDVITAPDIEISFIEFDVCAANQVHIAASSTSQIIEIWNWNFEQGTVITQSDGNFTSEQTVLFPSVNTSFNYSLIAVGNNNCQQTINGTINVPNSPEFVLNTDVITHPTCEEPNGSISVVPQNGMEPYEFTWSHNGDLEESSAENLPAANYTINVVDINTCSASLQVALIDDTSLPQVDLGSDREICENESLVLSAGNDGEFFQWYQDEVLINGANTNELEINSAAVYSVEVSNSDCTSTDDVAISILPTPEIIGVEDTSICDGDELSIDLSCDGCSYFWNTGENTSTVNFSTEGNYAVTVTSIDDCSTNASMNLMVLDNPNVELGENQIICAGEEILIGVEAELGTTYIWQNEETASQVFVGEQGLFTLTAIDENNCQASDDLVVSIAEPFALSIVADQDSICLGDTILLSVDGADEYLWISGLESLSDDTLAFPLVYPSVTTRYSVIGFNHCFTDTTYIDIGLFEQSATAGNDTCIVINNSIELTASGGLFYQWEESPFILGSDDIPNPSVEVMDSTWFFVQIIDQNACLTNDSVLVAVIKNPFDIIKAINIITPNGDGDNDVLNFEGLQKFTQNQLTVFNRWGEKVFEKFNYQNDWGGTFGGLELPAAVYFYVLKIGEEEIKSALTIIRE